MSVEIREAQESELGLVLSVERAAFGAEEEAQLVCELLEDGSAKPLLSLLAFEGGRAVGHVLFTRAGLEPQTSLGLALLAPLAVIPEAQNRGIGGALIERGVELLCASGVALVFVLGHPGYYPRYGFEPAGELGFFAPYPIVEKNADAWMVRGLQGDIPESLSGRVLCADALDKPEYWRE